MHATYNPVFYTRRELPEPEALSEAIQDALLEPSMLGPGNEPTIFEQFQLPKVCLEYLRVSAPFLFRGTMAANAYTMMFVDACPGIGNSLNFSMIHGAGYMGVFPPRGEIEAITPPGLGIAKVNIPAALMERTLELCFPELPEQILKHGIGIRLAKPDCVRMRNLMLDLRRESGQSDNLLTHTIARSRLEDELLAAFLESLRNALPQSERCRTPLSQARRQALLQDAIVIIEEGAPAADISNLCRQLKCSRRKMEYLFRELTGTSPTRFIKAIRLHKARSSLLSMDAGEGRVKTAALEAGFWHFGRFSNDYQALFGERPIDTLRRYA